MKRISKHLLTEKENNKKKSNKQIRIKRPLNSIEKTMKIIFLRFN